MTEQAVTAQTEAQRRAAEAAEDLAAEGAPVTNRTVRQRAGVAMAVAAETARALDSALTTLSRGSPLAARAALASTAARRRQHGRSPRPAVPP